MKNKQIQEFFTKVAQDESFKAEVLKLQKGIEAKKLNEQDVQKFVKEKLLPKAKKLGYDFSEKDLADFGNSAEMANLTKLSLEDMENIAGGVWPLLAAGGAALSLWCLMTGCNGNVRQTTVRESDSSISQTSAGSSSGRSTAVPKKDEPTGSGQQSVQAGNTHIKKTPEEEAARIAAEKAKEDDDEKELDVGSKMLEMRDGESSFLSDSEIAELVKDCVRWTCDDWPDKCFFNLPEERCRRITEYFNALSNKYDKIAFRNKLHNAIWAETLRTYRATIGDDFDVLAIRQIALDIRVTLLPPINEEDLGGSESNESVHSGIQYGTLLYSQVPHIAKYITSDAKGIDIDLDIDHVLIDRCAKAFATNNKDVCFGVVDNVRFTIRKILVKLYPDETRKELKNIRDEILSIFFEQVNLKLEEIVLKGSNQQLSEDGTKLNIPGLISLSVNGYDIEDISFHPGFFVQLKSRISVAKTQRQKYRLLMSISKDLKDAVDRTVKRIPRDKLETICKENGFTESGLSKTIYEECLTCWNEADYDNIPNLRSSNGGFRLFSLRPDIAAKFEEITSKKNGFSLFSEEVADSFLVEDVTDTPRFSKK